MPYDSSGNWVPAGAGGGDKYGDSYVGQSNRNNSDPGWLGTDVFRGDVYKPNAESFANPDDQKNKQLLSDYFNSLGGRSAPQMSAATAGTAYTTPAAYAGPGATWGGATIDTGMSDEDRAMQMGLAKQLQGEAAGTSPSLAAETMKQGLAANLQQQASLAGSMGGAGNPALAMRNLQYGAAAQNQQLIGQTGLARLQEQMAAQQQLGQLSSGMRGQDIGLATNQAGLAQQTGIFNASQQNQFSLANAGFEQQANLANQQAKNQFGLQNAQWQQQAGLANQQADLGLMGMNQEGQQWALGQNIGMSEADRQAAMDYEQMMGQQSLGANQLAYQAYSSAAQGRAKFAGGLMSALGGALSDENQKTDVADESSVDPLSRTNMGDGGGGEDYTGKRFGNFLQGFGSSISGTSPAFAKVPSIFGGDDKAATSGGEPDISSFVHGDRATFAERAANEQQLLMDRNAAPAGGGSDSGSSMLMGAAGGLMGGGGTGDILSDEEQKKSVTSQGASSKLLEPLHPYSYEYKDPTLPGASPGRHLGVMAQDLEKTVYGEQSVADTPQGKMVDYSKLAPAHLAASADMHRRLSVVESMLGVGAQNEGDEKTDTEAKPGDGEAKTKASKKAPKKGKG